MRLALLPLLALAACSAEPDQSAGEDVNMGNFTGIGVEVVQHGDAPQAEAAANSDAPAPSGNAL